MAKKILILGGGYGGLLTALTARKHLTAGEAQITIINRYPTHQIITELHRLAGGTIKEKAVALPLQKLLGDKQVNVLVDTIKEIKPNEKQVLTSSGAVHTYDALVVALGSETNYFGIPGLEANSMILKSADDANRIRQHVEARLDAYKASGNKADATIVVGGGGLTGVELVGEFADKLPEVCRSKGIDFADVSIYCVEAGPAILPIFPKVLIDRAVTSLEKRGITFLTGVAITEATKNTVSLKSGQTIESNTIIWTGGVKGNSVVGSCGIAEDRGRATVTSTLQSTSHADVYLAGDCAVVFPEGSERPYPPTAQLAWQMGETVGYNLSVQIKGGVMDKFVPVFSGTLGSLGRKDGVGTIGGSNTQLKGLPATLMKEASNIRYLSHIHGLFALAY
ncbi:pyridine nucleotide-disulfide oxidoreductase [Paenibacillus pectinilyticus]|uniref:Pyridine nucleotide-disulfide oxidoreductase n=1 Tax=Paenibacillus pectinilyticus TaxID=512399 RepID=A0A1C0ZZV5_9BACL|nr:NAD(P)/FAD-dependent oxidoreductase [Paenibacillus pectinilyticus]OCT13658.1 pyridine nucleotide-disulfide oxidoreductase [Paenibacillus pectinilyticus]